MDKSTVKIVVSGPESCGKTELCHSLDRYLGTEHIPEYARAYVEGLNRPYTFEDVEHIARTQQDMLSEYCSRGHETIVMDTYLVITKVWFTEVYGSIPHWIDHALKTSEINLFLLCYYDLPWIKDPVRENPGRKRKYLFEKYLHEIRELGFPCEVVKGTGTIRVQNAIEAVIRHFPQLKME